MTKLRFTTLFLLSIVALAASAYALRRVSVHDPSIVYDPSSSMYYVFGSHRATARSRDLMSWTTLTATWGLADNNGTLTNTNAANSVAFRKNMTQTIDVLGQQTAFGPFDVQAWASAYGNGYSIDGNLWAPDVIFNKDMQKWCLYLSINGPTWNSAIILLTADQITGPYVYQGPVVYSGFNVNDLDAVSYTHTDMPLVIGSGTALPSRYRRGSHWGTYWPHCIDPCVFYDEEGNLLMSYGSWSGGIWVLRLNKQTGLRDYSHTYTLTGSEANVSVDPYFGVKIAGGYYVSGEGSYISHIGSHYFLFVTNGGLEAAKGYQMRVFRSSSPEGPFHDASGVSAIYSGYAMNYGPNADRRGVNILGAYGDWGNMAKGDNSERSQGHCSVITNDRGQSFLVYHTRFQNRGEMHQVRVHQLFLNADGWLCAAPFEYTGETVTNDDMAQTQQVGDGDVPGTYKMLVHRYGLNHNDKELATPIEVQLMPDGTVTGDRTGRWQTTAGKSYLTLILGGTVYRGVLVNQTMEPSTTSVVAFTAMANSGTSIWGYRTKAYTVPTAIAAPQSYSTDFRHYFNLRGQRVDKPGKGIYVVGGKKIIVP